MLMLQGTAIKCICRYEKMTLTSQKDVSYSLKSTVVVVSLITFSNYGMTFILSFKKDGNMWTSSVHVSFPFFSI